MIQLKIHTEYSFGKTFASIGSVIARLKELNCTAAAITDNNSWGHVVWFKACKEAGIQPMLGMEICVADEDTEHIQYMTFIAKTTKGLSELYRAASKSHQTPISTKFGQAPRLYKNDVSAMSTEIVKLSGDITDGEFLSETGAYIDISPASRILTMKKRQLAKEFGLKAVGVSDNSYCKQEDKEVYELISRAGLKQTPQYILPELEGQEHAAEIAAMCAGLELPQAPMIHFPGDLLQLCRDGIAFRGMQDRWTEEYETRLQYELELIKSKDFESYFLIVADLMQYAKSVMLVGPARGSSAGSIVCYLTRITEVDPIPPGLIFERFIDISRSDLPDIDSDFPDNKRHLIFEYMAEKYGMNNVAHIGTLSQFKPKSALIQVCKALNIPAAATASVKVAMIERSSADSRANNCLQDTLETTEPGRAFIRMYPQAAAAALIEGHCSHTGVHAAGLLICNDEIMNYATVDANGIAHIDKHSAEDLGLLKIDVLGLRTLGILEDSGIDIDWYNLSFDDEKTYELFNSGRFCGIFQFDGNALRAVSGRIKFKDLGDIDAVTALARPGPFGGGVTEEFCLRKMGKDYVRMHPAIDAHLNSTYGLPVYQEQTMNLVRHVGKFSWKDTSIIRKAMSKRLGKEFFDTHFDKFKVGAAEQGVGEEEARTTWDLINSFGAWAFNKCLSGETMVRIAKQNQYHPAWISIEELYRIYVIEPSSWMIQNKSMPMLISMEEDGRGRPQYANTIHKNGKKPCWRLTFENGGNIECTVDHKFIIDGEWRQLAVDGKAPVVGEEFTFLRPVKQTYENGHEQFFARSVSVEFVGDKETYDIEMPTHHNFVVNGGLVTHNSHSHSYAVVSYWTAYLKAHHPLEFAACNLRNAKDEEAAVELLREMVREGINYVAFDIEKSSLNWSAIDGVLYGGFVSLKGIGENKAAKLIEARNAGKLTAKQREDVAKRENVFADLNPLHTKYAELYADPAANGIACDKLWCLNEITEGIPHGEERVFIAELIYKNARDANEDVNIKKRGGKVETGQTNFVDMRLRDDTGMIGGRINRFDYDKMGREFIESIPIGAALLIRAKFFNGIRYCFVSKYKVLS